MVYSHGTSPPVLEILNPRGYTILASSETQDLCLARPARRGHVARAMIESGAAVSATNRPGAAPGSDVLDQRTHRRALVGLVGSSGPGLRHDLRPNRARRRENTVIASQVRAGSWHQRGESGNKALKLDKVAGSDFEQPKAGPKGGAALQGEGRQGPDREAGAARSIGSASRQSCHCQFRMTVMGGGFSSMSVSSTMMRCSPVARSVITA